MKKIVVLLIYCFTSVGEIAQSAICAWEAIGCSENGDKIRSVVIFTEG